MKLIANLKTKIKQKVKESIFPFAYFIKSKPILFRLAVNIIKYFPRLDNKIRSTLSNDVVQAKSKLITLADDKLAKLNVIKAEIEGIKKNRG